MPVGRAADLHDFPLCQADEDFRNCCRMRLFGKYDQKPPELCEEASAWRAGYAGEKRHTAARNCALYAARFPFERRRQGSKRASSRRGVCRSI